MNLSFAKMQGAGNDFIIIKASELKNRLTGDTIIRLCDRKRGIGADGIMFLGRLPDGRINMDFYNSDGSEASLCGNGLRCAAAFSYRFGLSDKRDMVFVTGGGELTSQITDDSARQVRIQMPVTEEFREYELENGLKVFKGAVGVPHAVVQVEDVSKVDIRKAGKELRFHPRFAPAGANVNFISPCPEKNCIRIRTYERGVEDETLACGTGVTSSAVCMRIFCGAEKKQRILCAGGDILDIEIIESCNIVRGAYLTGPAELSFTGSVEIMQ